MWHPDFVFHRYIATILDVFSAIRKVTGAGELPDCTSTSEFRSVCPHNDRPVGLSKQISREGRLDYFRLSDQGSVIPEAPYLGSQQI
jgi:hypothetical protein